MASYAPRHDLELLRNLDTYKETNNTLATIAMQKILGHLWYLSDELIALSFFDDNVAIETKRKMVVALEKMKNPAAKNKRATLQPQDISTINLEDFVSDNHTISLKHYDPAASRK